MKDLMARLKVLKEKAGVLNKELAAELGIANSNISSYFSGKQQISFMNFLSVLDYLQIEREEKKSYISSYIARTTKKESFKEILEWSSNHGLIEVNELISSRFLESDPKNKLPVYYQLLNRRNRKDFIGQEILFFREIEDAKKGGYNYEEVEAFSQICSLYAYMDLNNFRMVITVADHALDQIEKISNNYLRESFRVRTLEMLAISYVKRNLVNEAERIANLILTDKNEKAFPLPTNSIYSLLSELYSFTDYEKSTYYLNKAFHSFEFLPQKSFANRRSMLEATHDFIHITNGRYNNLFMTSSAEKAHYYAMNGQRSEALKILDELERTSSNGLTAHQLYYKAIAMQDADLIRKSYQEFILQGDLFYSHLPSKYMKVKICL